ncbi:hypothetical protein CLAFUW4_01011 [Fulvia fulva]|uniref:Uncharacterized protein n=1 Tax=Passalora fulva TaxID=5499 RepID=A0A9Q8L879_PASFU|nr:uncharacterized protein CLAFUR5_01017 [Fulvia fulva]KAK4634275.1 hypothetical protein CLAFUR4_01012 [Fulvia fulva]KAK4637076.1 hypothetical protein CLAFUR0_01013 [Fulvia fulva]UJO12663.1 hypothetical protein CLAFUR5_01017 [Fulvia fulva]WPV10218.1 hypothetical protein CLAFUW4_01011 [Fulvia fulva]WPV25216.1 hypothetical protein CLAFUW7_00805 [Fulvia fulva]
MPEELRDIQAKATQPTPETPQVDRSDEPDSPQKSLVLGKSSSEIADPLSEFNVGDEVRCTRADGSTSNYIVAASRLSEKKMWEYQLRASGSTTKYNSGQWIAESQLAWP